MRLHKSSQKPPLPPPAPARPPAAPPKVIYLRAGRLEGQRGVAGGIRVHSAVVVAVQRLSRNCRLTVCPPGLCPIAICLRSTHAPRCGCRGQTVSEGLYLNYGNPV